MYTPMQQRRAERGSRGHYARLICQNCRSRKIKCNLQDADAIEPSSVPQTAERSCKRCRDFKLDCIVEQTSLGRPAAKRARHTDLEGAISSTVLQPRTQDDEAEAFNPGIDGYFFSEAADDNLMSQDDNQSTLAGRPSKQRLFQSMIDAANLFSSVMASDQGFGAGILPTTSRWSKPLPSVIGDDFAASLDEWLVWQRFFLPQIPSLVSIRHRLTSDVNATENSATNLLFALLCLIALETLSTPPRQSPELMGCVRLAVSTYGQAFIFDPPTHRDSILVSLLLFDYKPTALVSSQIVAHTAVKSSLFVHLAYRIAERLGLICTQASLGYQNPIAATSLNLDPEPDLIDSFQRLQIYCREACLDGFVAQSLRKMRHVLNCIKPHVDAYSSILQSRLCSPRILYHIQAAIADYILMSSLADMKQGWNELKNVTGVIEDAERKVQEQIAFNNGFHAGSSEYMESHELSVVLRLLELRYHSVFTTICGMGLVYAMVLKARFKDGRDEKDPEIHAHEGIQMATHVIESFKDTSDGRIQNISEFLTRFGLPFPTQLENILEQFVNFSEDLKLNGVKFHPPPRHLVLEVVKTCKNLVENNILQLKGFGKLHANFEKQLQLFDRCAHELEAMATSPENTINQAFASGCVYAAASKMTKGLHDLMLSLKTRIPEGSIGEQHPKMLEEPTDFNALEGSDIPFATNEWNWWPHVEFNFFEMMQEQAGQPFDLNLFPEF